MTHNKHIKRLVAFSVVFAFVFSSCSKKLPEETLPPATSVTVAETTLETEATEETTTVEETTPEPTKAPSHGPNSTAVVTDMPVPLNGQLSVKDTCIVNEAGEIVQLKGMSLYGINYTGKFFSKDTCQTLAEDWGCDVIRLAMYTIGSTSKAYIDEPDKYFQLMCDYIDLCVDQGVYCIVDWHILFDGDPMQYKEESIDFFSRISAIYADCPNVIYEICNEPNGKSLADESVDVGWDNCIRPYAVEVIEAIRANDPDNIIIVGTPNWSQFADDAAKDPIDDENVMYTIHFYAGSHGEDVRSRMQSALDSGLALFCTEWGTTFDNGGGTVDTESSDEWLEWLDSNHISWCNWSIGGSASESSNALRMGSDSFTPEEKYGGHWPDEFLTTSGYYVKCKLLDIPYEPEGDN